MDPLSPDELRHLFTSSEDFNELFDTLEEAIRQRIEDIDVYRLLFWNKSLKMDELIFFGERLVLEFPNVAYDIYMWLAQVFQTTFGLSDNYHAATRYYQKAALVRPSSPDPYLELCDCYDADLNIPPLDALLEFVNEGLHHVEDKKPLYSRLAYLYKIIGDDERSNYYLRLGGVL
jgi:hypothetical protein